MEFSLSALEPCVRSQQTPSNLIKLTDFDWCGSWSAAVPDSESEPSAGTALKRQQILAEGLSLDGEWGKRETGVFGGWSARVLDMWHGHVVQVSRRSIETNEARKFSRERIRIRVRNRKEQFLLVAASSAINYNDYGHLFPSMWRLLENVGWKISWIWAVGSSKAKNNFKYRSNMCRLKTNTIRIWLPYHASYKQNDLMIINWSVETFEIPYKFISMKYCKEYKSLSEYQWISDPSYYTNIYH